MVGVTRTGAHGHLRPGHAAAAGALQGDRAAHQPAHQPVGLLRIRLSALASEVGHAASLPLCASRKQGGKIAATANLTIKARVPPCCTYNAPPLGWADGDRPGCWDGPRHQAPNLDELDGHRSCSHGLQRHLCWSGSTQLARAGFEAQQTQVPCSCPGGVACEWRDAPSALPRSGLPDLALRAQVSYPNKVALARAYFAAPRPTGVYRHGLNRGDVRVPLEYESSRIILRWLETSNPAVAKPVAQALLKSHKCAPASLGCPVHCARYAPHLLFQPAPMRAPFPALLARHQSGALGCMQQRPQLLRALSPGDCARIPSGGARAWLWQLHAWGGACRRCHYQC